jgi:D-tagatose-1,6-bisphosphate aldolase subunit GatZ/KbaZ
MADMRPNLEGHTAFQPSIEEMYRILEENRAGKRRGIYSVCSANKLVLAAAFVQAARDRSPVLIEATCNQVNQEGGYTGLTPAQFRDCVLLIAEDMKFPTGRLILGGDHLGPNPWRTQPASIAMDEACAMVRAYAAAGFSKIHLDASMPCGDDPRPLASEEIARRSARLCEAAESALAGSPSRPVYVIGTEVPTPGGAQEELEISVTTTASLQTTLDTHHEAFVQKGLSSAWQRVIGVVVQPGVEFGDETVADYVPERASALARSIVQYQGMVFEAHSTDYQTGESLQRLVSDHFGILKVGPELTFVMREAVFGLARIEEEWIAEEQCSNIRGILEQVMVRHPENWSGYYRGHGGRLRVARAYSLSDRIRYYWPRAEVSEAIAVLTENLRRRPAPLPLVAQYLPRQAEAIRAGIVENDPDAIIRHKIQETLSRYAHACGLTPHKPV